MTAIITPITKAQRALEIASTPAESKAVEALAAAAKAYAKEQGDFELVIEAGRIYILARRKTTELIQPSITKYHGNQHVGCDIDVTSLTDYGFTRKQWSRRLMELKVPETVVDGYIDDCIEKNTEPTILGLLRFSSSSHVSDDTYEWYTPEKYIEAARAVMGSIDLDPASTEKANEVIKAEVIYTEEDDGLSKPWFGNVWLNPPYNMPEVELFIDTTISQYEDGNIDSAIVLINNSTDTGWFHRLLKYPVCFTKGRIKFWSENGKELATRQGQAFFYLGDNLDLFAKHFGAFGAVMVKYDHQ